MGEDAIKKHLAKFALAALFMAGAAYGYLSAMMNQNPYYPPVGTEVAEEQRAKAWHWDPSPLWLPSYLVATVPRNGVGIRHTRSGYLFRQYEDRLIYFTASTVTGTLLLFVPACIIYFMFRRSRSGSAASAGRP